MSEVINRSSFNAWAHCVGEFSTREKCPLAEIVEDWDNCKDIATLYVFMKLTLKHILLN